MACSIPRKEVTMKSSQLETQLDDLLKEYVLENLDWPESEEELDQFLLTRQDEQIDRGSDGRVARVLSQIGRVPQSVDDDSCSGRAKQLAFFDTAPRDIPSGSGKSCTSQSLRSLFNIVREAYLEV